MAQLETPRRASSQFKNVKLFVFYGVFFLARRYLHVQRTKDSTTVHSDVQLNCESSSSHKSSHFDVSKSTQKHDQEVQSQANRGMIEGGLVVDSKQDLGLLKEGSASSFEVEDSIEVGLHRSA